MQGHPRPSVVLDANAGTWGDGVDVRGSWWREMCEPRASDAGHAAITDAAGDPNQVGRDDRSALTAGINPVLRDEGAAWHRVRAEGKSGVTECARSGLDADTRSRGAANGIGDLPTGEVLPATEGRATRVSVAAPHEDRPWPEPSADARADVDRLCRAWSGARVGRVVGPPRVRASRPAVSQVLSHARRHGRGEPRAVQRASRRPGAVCERPRPRGALMVARAVNETGRSPQMGACVSPIRLALVDAVHRGRRGDTSRHAPVGRRPDHVAHSHGRTPDRRGHGDDRVCVQHRPRAAAQPPRCGGRGTPARDPVSDGP